MSSDHTMLPELNSNDFVFLQLSNTFEFDICRCGNYYFFSRFEFIVCSKFNHTQMWPYICMCCGLLVPTQFHFECRWVFDDSRYHKNLYRRWLQKKKWNHCGRSCGSIVIFGFWWWKKNRTIWLVIPSEVSLRKTGDEQFCQVKRMIGESGTCLCLCSAQNVKVMQISNNRG